VAINGATGEEWGAVVEAERDDDDGLDTPILVLVKESDESANALRVKLNGIYRTAEEAIAAGREAVKSDGDGRQGLTPYLP